MLSRGNPSPLVHFQPGELVFSVGERGKHAYIIESGQVDIFVVEEGEETSLKVLIAGDVFGEMAVIDDSPRSASARALTETKCVVVSSEQISERIETSDPVVKLLVSTLLTRMRSITLMATDTTISYNVLSSLMASTQFNDSWHRQSVLDKMRLESELREALETDAFESHYQPLVEIETGNILGFEFLVRWKSPTRGNVSPALFISIADETSLIIPVGLWTIEKACQDLKRFNQAIASLAPPSVHRPPLFLSINVSARQFRSAQFLEHVLSILRQYEIDCAQIKLEITERVLLEGDVAVKAIQRCREMGLHISLDDFGTGFSSLSYLAHLDIDSLKIDQCFVKEMLSHQRTLILIKTILAMAQDLNMPSLAEGVETRAQHDTLQELGCQIGQGYWYGKPTPYAEAEKLLLSNYRR